MKFKDLEIEANTPNEDHESDNNRFTMEQMQRIMDTHLPPIRVYNPSMRAREAVRETATPWHVRLYHRISNSRHVRMNEHAVVLIIIAVLFLGGLLVGLLIM